MVIDIVLVLVSAVMMIIGTNAYITAPSLSESKVQLVLTQIIAFVFVASSLYLVGYVVG